MNQNDIEDDDVPYLSAETFAALQEFYREEELRSKLMAEEMPKEDWQLSQFWYDDVTSKALAQEAINAAGPNGRIACISCPSIFLKLRELSPEHSKNGLCLEYDKRFSSAFGESFLFYDYNEPLNLPEDARKVFDLVILDPPFLSRECLEKSSKTANFLAKNKIILCTGSIMEDAAKSLLEVERHTFRPKHSNNLSNEFSCFVNYTTFSL